MKRVLSILFALYLMPFVAQAQESTPITVDNMRPFHSIRVLGNLSVEISASEDKPSMYVDIKGNDPRRFDWSVRDSVLTLSFSANSNGNAVQVKLSSPTPIEKLTIKRADVQLCDMPTTPLVDVALSEGARLSGCVNCLDMHLKLTGRSVANMTGRAKYQTISVSRKSALNVCKVEGCSTELQAGGSSEVYVCATERFVGDVKGRTSVFYDGNPTIIRIEKHKLSTVNSIGAK